MTKLKINVDKIQIMNWDTSEECDAPRVELNENEFQELKSSSM